MPNPYGVAEVSVQEVARKRADNEDLVLMDVREQQELQLANLGEDAVWVPLSDLSVRRLEAIPPSLEDKQTEIVVFCHTGVRSAQVAAWLVQEGWVNVWNMNGGIDAYARQVEPNVGLY